MSGTQDHAHAQDTHAEAHDAHEGPIKTPKQLAVAVFFAFVIPIVIIVMLANYVSSEVKPAAGSTGLDEQAVAARIQPVGSIELKDLSNPAAMKSGEQVFQAQCAACHAAGVAGAPKFGDADAWGPRVKTGVDALVHSALKGKGNMGPQGGGDFSDFEISRAVVYMANHGGAKFDDPKLPAAAASGAAADAGASAPATAASGASQ
ncbi:cytochrome c5 family protein [Roseateles aquatilis]|uniref:Cytochrome c5 family protein n=1 Tax=Roseateles aquatilis TaxID=431061 RepID=A0A246J0S9_9BURK|nr:c-type cytochrome [Roseateles aquatilis]OWQ86210.1 cytochrome c5 family protein [Roseateles aquatilis]